MFEYFSPTFGLVTKEDPTTENGGLFFAHYLVLKKLLKLQITTADYLIFREKMSAAKVKDGLYLRSSHHTTRTVSQDEITGMMVTCAILGTGYRSHIWNRLLKGFGNYPATGKAKFYNPGNFWAWGELACSNIAWIFAPIYLLNLVISCAKPKQDTSSKLLYFSELNTLKDRSRIAAYFYRHYELKMVKMYGPHWVNELFTIYFKDEEHPLRLLAEKV